MTFDFFEGAAGTGKTYNLVGRAGELVQGGVLGDGHKLLALTFMNGARRRLDTRLGENSAFRKRFDCQTFDVFARTLAARRRSLITQPMSEQAAALNQFDGPCALTALLLENELVQLWIARTFPTRSGGRSTRPRRAPHAHPSRAFAVLPRRRGSRRLPMPP
jgi:superfamily I DNA/RNA helicase